MKIKIYKIMYFFKLVITKYSNSYGIAQMWSNLFCAFTIIISGYISSKLGLWPIFKTECIKVNRNFSKHNMHTNNF